jgi:hypothetical protein
MRTVVPTILRPGDQVCNVDRCGRSSRLVVTVVGRLVQYKTEGTVVARCVR